MSKFQSRIFINNPEKDVPDNIIEQFFLAIKSGDLDKIRDFALEYKNKYNVIEKYGRGNNRSTMPDKTPSHIVLELDNKIADNDAKLKILKFLDQMGAPFDLPDSNDVWPIHLAASLQDPKILDFFIKKGVQIDRKDTSNNTPLHYAIYGREIDCPKQPSIKPLNPQQKIENISLNKILDDTNILLTKYIGQNKINNVHENLIHIINTIMKIPEMYKGDVYSTEIESDIIKIFTEIATSSSFSSDSKNNYTSMSEQQNKLEQLIERTRSKINDELLKGVTDKLVIGPNKGGWGPQIPSGTRSREPTDLEKIMEESDISFKTEINNQYNEALNEIISINTNKLDYTVINNINNLRTLIFDNMNKLMFEYGKEVSITKIFVLSVWNHYVHNFSTIFVGFILDNLLLLNNNLFGQIMDGDINNPIYTPNVGDLTIFSRNHVQIIDELQLIGPDLFNKNIHDLLYTFLNSGYIDSDILNINITYKLKSLFSNSTNLDIKPVNLLYEKIGKSKLRDLLKDPSISYFKTNNDSFSDLMNMTWFDALFHVLKQIFPIQPDYDIVTDVQINDRHNIPNKITVNLLELFYDKNTNRLQIPKTPLPSARYLDPWDNENNNYNEYTFFELFRIMDYVSNYLITYRFELTSYPLIFSYEINNWIEYIEEYVEREQLSHHHDASHPYIGSKYPEFVFLYKILISYARNDIINAINSCTEDILNNALSFPLDDFNSNLIRQYRIGNDLTALSILMPSQPDFSEIVTDNSPILQVKDNKQPYLDLIEKIWKKETTIYKIFSVISNEVLSELYTNICTKIIKLINNSGPNLDSSFYDNIRIIIEKIAVKYNDQILHFVHNKNFESDISKYLIFSISPSLNKIFDEIKYKYTYDDNLQKLKDKKMTETFFLVETYGFFFYRVWKRLEKYILLISSVNNVIADTIAFINNKTYYHIPQIFMPALVKQIIIAASELIKLKKFINKMKQKKTEFYSLIDTSNSHNQNILKLADDLFKTIRDSSVEFYNLGLLEIIKYHNKIINFLNIHSSYQLINLNQTGITKFFDNNLTLIQNFPDNFEEDSDVDLLKKIIDAYSIPEITYYADNDELKNSLYVKNIIGVNYKNIITYSRNSHKISNLSRNGQNFQLNITEDRYGDMKIIKDFNRIAGKWLNVNYKKLNRTKYADALIKYTEKEFILDKTRGMPLSIKSLVGYYLKNKKQIIIQDIIQYIINQSTINTGDKELVKMYNDIKLLANENTYDNVSDVKVYVIIGQLADSIINKLLDYSIRQCISTWIYSFVLSNPKFGNIINKINNTINIINQKDYQKLSLNNVNKNEIENLAKTDDKYLDFSLMQIEPNPKELSYVTKSVDKKFIYYLYNINYYSSTNINTREKCRHINPKIAEKLINSKTLNLKNSDGKTPLQYAVEIGHPGLVKLLISRGANPYGFYNIKGQNAYDIAVYNIREFLKYTVSADINPNVYSTIENFAIPFNDLLASRLKDDKFGNNVIKNITSAIPIQLIMYNHMFKLHLENYRYGFSSQLKNSFKSVIGKRYNYYDVIYPIDLFNVDNEKQLLDITEKNDVNLTIQNNINKGNKKKIDGKEKLIAQLKIQIDGLAEEKKKTSDPDQIKFIDKLSDKLIANKNKYDQDLKQIVIKTEPKLDKGLMEIYLDSVKSINKTVIDRSFDILQFYDYGFNKIGKNKNFYVAIWNNYIHKDLKNAPSMIFPVISDTILHLINNDLLIRKSSSDVKLYINSSDVKNDFDKIVDFLTVVRDYIEMKDSFPNDKIDPEENPILAQECEQIIYLINLILTPAIRNILLSQIYQGIKEMDTLGKIITDHKDILDEILSSELNGGTLDSFLNNILPKKMYKYITNSYVSDYDPDRKILNGSDIFEPIIDFIKQFRKVQITDESILIKNIKDHLVPFMINTYQNFIHHLRLAIYGYERYLLNMYQNAVIMQTLMHYDTIKKI